MTAVKSIERILCPTDFGTCAHGALQQALMLAHTHDARVDLVHVANVPRYVRRDMTCVLGASGAKPLSEIAVDECNKQMALLISELSDDDKRLVTTHCRFGTPITTILQYAHEHRTDLIVLGAAGNARVSKYLLGGTAGKTVRQAECPVMCVPSDQAREIHKVLVATDFSECSERALAVAASLARAAHATLQVAHVTPSAWSLPAELNVGLSGQGTNWLELLQREARERLDDFTAKARTRGIHVDDEKLLIGSPAQSLLQHASEGGFDLIVLGTHGRSAIARLMLGSVAETVVHHAVAPVVTVRSEVVPTDQ